MKYKELLEWLYKASWLNRDNQALRLKVYQTIDRMIIARNRPPDMGENIGVIARDVIKELLIQSQLPVDQLDEVRLFSEEKSKLIGGEFEANFEKKVIRECQSEILKALCQENIKKLLKKLGQEVELPNEWLDQTTETLSKSYKEGQLSTTFLQLIREYQIIKKIEDILDLERETEVKFSQINNLLNEQYVMDILQQKGKEYGVLNNLLSAIRELIADIFGVWKSRGRILREFAQEDMRHFEYHSGEKPLTEEEKPKKNLNQKMRVKVLPGYEFAGIPNSSKSCAEDDYLDQENSFSDNYTL